MKIKILIDVPVHPNHGITKGRVFETLPKDGRGQWVMGDAGEKVKVHPHEYEQIHADS